MILPAPSGLATLAAGDDRATFDVDLTLKPDEVVEAAEDLLFQACRATVQPVHAADCDGPVLGRDFLILDDDAPEDILYWDATLTPAASEDVDWFVGYLVTTDTPPVIEGALSTTEFACCRGRQSTETAWTVNALGRSDDRRARPLVDRPGVVRRRRSPGGRPARRGAAHRRADVPAGRWHARADTGDA